jgi:hypothetical protein
MVTTAVTEAPAVLHRTVSEAKAGYGAVMLAVTAGDVVLGRWAQRSGEPVAFLMVGPQHVAACLAAMGIDPETVQADAV